MTADVTVLMAIRGASAASRLALESLRARTSPWPPVLVADNGSDDDLRMWLADQADLTVVPLSERIRAAATEREREDASGHAASLDALVDRVRTEWFLTLDSDVEVLRPGWVAELLAFARVRGARVVGEFEPGSLQVKPRLAPHALIVHTATFRRHGRSFRGRTEIDDPAEAAQLLARPRPSAFRLTEQEARAMPSARFWSTGAPMFERIVNADVPWEPMPVELAAGFRHFGHLSWAGKHSDLVAEHEARLADVHRRRRELAAPMPSGGIRVWNW